MNFSVSQWFESESVNVLDPDFAIPIVLKGSNISKLTSISWNISDKDDSKKLDRFIKLKIKLVFSQKRSRFLKTLKLKWMLILTPNVRSGQKGQGQALLEHG